MQTIEQFKRGDRVLCIRCCEDPECPFLGRVYTVIEVLEDRLRVSLSTEGVTVVLLGTVIVVGKDPNYAND